MADLFRRPHHNAILAALRSLNGDLFADAECYFGGGTAIVLKLDEYRESVDIDFLCASQDGYRILRQAVFGKGLAGLIRDGADVKELRDMKADQYGIRTFLEIQDTKIKFEIVRESRVPLSGEFDDAFGVPVLSREDMYLEKLLANADRCHDKSVMSRDIIDISLMMTRWGDIPDAAWERAREVYGDIVEAAYASAVEDIRDVDRLLECMKKMSMDENLVDEILLPHGGPRPKGGYG